ncbi:MAG: hypothetical protein IMY72_09020 [Bacteroidetes bacterium]|nr:hypothetical protein [Bacteroidota bacterium]
MTKKLISVLYILSSIIVLVGAFCKIQHYSNGFTILIFGFMLGTITRFIDDCSLKNNNKKNEEKN